VILVVQAVVAVDQRRPPKGLEQNHPLVSEMKPCPVGQPLVESPSQTSAAQTTAKASKPLPAGTVAVAVLAEAVVVAVLAEAAVAAVAAQVQPSASCSLR